MTRTVERRGNSSEASSTLPEAFSQESEEGWVECRVRHASKVNNQRRFKRKLGTSKGVYYDRSIS
jgi:hypothetical protein